MINGEISDVNENDGCEYTLKGKATVYGDNINTYVSNETSRVGNIEAVEMTVVSDKDGKELNPYDDINYTVELKNIGKKNFLIF